MTAKVRHKFEQRHEFRVSKSSLKSIVKEEFLEKFDNLVERANYILDDVMMFINDYVANVYNEKKTLPKINRNFILHCIKIMGFLKKEKDVSEANKGLFGDLLNFYKTHYNRLYEHEKNDLYNFKAVKRYLAEDILTNIENNIKLYYIHRLKKYLWIFGCNILDPKSKMSVKEKHKIIDKLVNNILKNKYKQIDKRFLSWFNEDVLGTIIPSVIVAPKKVKKFRLNYNAKSDPSKFILYTLNIHRAFENHNKQIDEKLNKIKEDKFLKEHTKLSQVISMMKKQGSKKLKLGQKYFELKNLAEQSPTIQLRKQRIAMFNSLPGVNFNMKYVTFDTTCLIELFVMEHGGKSKALRLISDERHIEVWSRFFHTDKRIFKESSCYTFNFMIQTDGVGCSLVFRRKGEELIGKLSQPQEYEYVYLDELPQDQIREYRNIGVIDPGEKDMIYGMDKFGTQFRYSAAQYRAQCRTNKYRDIMVKKKPKEVKQAELELSKCLSKTTDREKYDEYLRVRAKHADILYNFYHMPLWRKLRFRTYTKKQAAQDNFVNQLEDKLGSDTLIVLGDWSKKHTLKGHLPSVTIGMRNMLIKKFDVVLIDENNTSKICHGCHGVTEKVYIGGQKIHRLLGCRKCNNFTPQQFLEASESTLTKKRKQKLIQRDTNSCMNMMCIVEEYLETGQRPEVFCTRQK